MPINNILVIEPDVEYHEVYAIYLPKHFPGATVTCVSDNLADLEAIAKRQFNGPFDLYITNYPYPRDFAASRPHDALLQRIETIRSVYQDAMIALVTGRTHLKALARAIRIDYFLKQSPTLFADIATRYNGGQWLVNDT